MSENQILTCKAAVCWAAGEPLKVETITVDPPKKDEVRIKILYTGICHTDEYTRSGQDAEGAFPCVLGHEGGGVVESVGENVLEIIPGDHVIPLYTAECRKCKMCKSSKTNLCSAVRATQGKGLLPDGTTRFKCKDREIFSFMGCSTFSQYTVVSIHSVVKVDPKANLEKVCLLGCGVTTGFGAATKVPNFQPGSDTVAVFGAGGTVGLAVVMGAKKMNAKRIIAVEVNKKKEKIIREMGATEFVNPNEVENVVEHLVNLTDGGLDYTFDCTGNVKVMRQALESCHKGWGVSTVIGVAPAGHEISTRPFQLVTGRVWRGSAFGGVKGRTEIPGLVKDYMDGNLKVDEFHTHSRTLEDINDGFADMKSGDCLRCVVSMFA